VSREHFQWSEDLIEAVRLTLLSAELDFVRNLAESATAQDVMLEPGLYQVKARGAAVAFALLEQGKTIARDSNGFPAVGIYLEPGEYEPPFRVRVRQNLVVEVDTGGSCQIRRLAQ
jgi:hypothetical protein